MPKVPFWVFVLLSLLYLSGAVVDVMDVDASQYAEMSREMSLHHSFLELYDRGKEYLDKPPFLFWVSAVSMKIFGANNFGYKLPSVLFAIWSLWATYRLARSLYDDRTGRAAALILGCCQGVWLMTNDVRTDTILMSWVVTAVWMIREWEVSGKRGYLFAGCAAMAFGMMTKGPIALIVPVFSFASHWALHRSWKRFFRWEYLPGILIIALLLVPMSIGLYRQFDLHPEKIVNGETGVSGLRFFYWTQSFGRITGENVWDNGAPFTFLLESMLWAFLPWTVIFLCAFIIRMIQIFRQRFRARPSQEWITAGGFAFSYLVLASSSYQLPHYIFVVFPLAAILTAGLLRDFSLGLYPRLYRVLPSVQSIIGGLLMLAVITTFAFVFEDPRWWLPWLFFTALWLRILFRSSGKGGVARILYSGGSAIIFVNLILTHHFYTRLMHYQLGSEFGRYIHQQQLRGTDIDIFLPEDPLNALHFYAQEAIFNYSDTSYGKGSYLLTMEKGKKKLDSAGTPYVLIKQGSYFKVSELTPEFLNPGTREQALKTYYFVQLQTKPK